METCIQDGLEIDGKKLVCVSLLTYSVSTPNGWQRFDDGSRIGVSTLRHLINETNIAALVAALSLSLALFQVILAHTQGVEGQRVSQALHHWVEKASVSQILHRKGHSRRKLTLLVLLWIVAFRALRHARLAWVLHEKIHSGIFNCFESARVAAWVARGRAHRATLLAPWLLIICRAAIVRAVIIVEDSSSLLRFLVKRIFVRLRLLESAGHRWIVVARLAAWLPASTAVLATLKLIGPVTPHVYCKLRWSSFKIPVFVS